MLIITMVLVTLTAVAVGLAVDWLIDVVVDLAKTNFNGQ